MRVTSEFRPLGHRGLPVVHLDGHERPQQHRAVAERRPRLCEPGEDLPQDGVLLEALRDDQVALDRHLVVKCENIPVVTKLAT